MSRGAILVVALLGGALCLPLRPAAAETLAEPAPSLTVALGAEYASGDYGSAVTTRSLYVPLTVTWTPGDRLDLGIEIPYLYQSSSTVTTRIYRSDGMVSSAAMGAGPGGPGGAAPMSGGSGGGGAGSDTSTAAGLGDIVLRAGLIAWHAGEHAPRLRTSLTLKCPTARRKEGLGTGEYDLGVGLDLDKWHGRLHLLGEGIYNYQGRVAGYGLTNYLSYSAGIGYQLDATLQPLLQVKGSTPPSHYADGVLELRARTLWSVARNTVLDLYLARALGGAGPDYGAGLSVGYSF